MSGFLALLDDVAALAKLAAAQIDDIAAQAGKAGAKAAGVVIDDSAVTPQYVQGLPAARELPIVMKIARGSLFNKLVILLPIGVFLNAFAPWLVTPLLMIGGLYLCFEGAEKLWHLFHPQQKHGPEPESLDAAHLESERVAGAIKTDFILSAEIMAISLAAIDTPSIWTDAIVLAVVAIGITAIVYGSVALLVKADDFGLRLSQIGRFAATRSLGRTIVKSMPGVLAFISAVGTVAMLWVGGSIIIHGMETFGWGSLGHIIHDLSTSVGQALPGMNGLLEWLVKAGLDGIFGVVLGLAVMPLATYILVPIAGMFKPRKAEA